MAVYQNQDPTFLTVDQVAKSLQVSRPSVYALFKTGKLTPVKINSSTRIRKTELEKLK